MGYRDTHMESPGPGLRVRVDTYTNSIFKTEHPHIVFVLHQQSTSLAPDPVCL